MRSKRYGIQSETRKTQVQYRLMISTNDIDQLVFNIFNLNSRLLYGSGLRKENVGRKLEGAWRERRKKTRVDTFLRVFFENERVGG